MKITEIIHAYCKGDQKWIAAILKSGEIGFGCNPNSEWKYVEELLKHKVKDSEYCSCVGNCLYDYWFTACDGETTFKVSYQTDSSN